MPNISALHCALIFLLFIDYSHWGKPLFRAQYIHAFSSFFLIAGRSFSLIRFPLLISPLASLRLARHSISDKALTLILFISQHAPAFHYLHIRLWLRRRLYANIAFADTIFLVSRHLGSLASVTYYIWWERAKLPFSTAMNYYFSAKLLRRQDDITKMMPLQQRPSAFSSMFLIVIWARLALWCFLFGILVLNLLPLLLLPRYRDL